MIWQDWVFSVGQWVLTFALIPTIIGKNKPALSTSLMTGTILATFATTFLTLELWLSAFSTGLTASAWFVLALQKYNQDRK